MTDPSLVTVPAWTAVLPWFGGGALAAFAAWRALGADAPRPGIGRWRGPALIAAAFLAFSVLAGVTEGPFGFWPEHVRNRWGNQIWFDLLLAAGTALTLIVPPARAVGMRVLPWSLLVVATGSIGLVAMLARLRWLQARVPAHVDGAAGPSAR